jgi:hypothetical protein
MCQTQQVWFFEFGRVYGQLGVKEPVADLCWGCGRTHVNDEIADPGESGIA